MRWIHHLIVFSGLVLGLVSKGLAQEIPSHYLQEALTNNLNLRGKKIPLWQKACLLLKRPAVISCPLPHSKLSIPLPGRA